MPMANILLVDDHPANLLALRAILEELGQDLVEARSGDEALRRLEAGEFAVVLLDVQMPGLDGFETARLIRGRETTWHTPILFVTAHDPDRLWAEEAYALGAVDYLVKPLVPVILRAKVAGFVDLYEKAEQIRLQAEQLRQLQRRGFERRLAEENARLRASEGRFARFMQHLPGLAWIKDVRGRYVYANQAAEAAFGIPRAELYGKTDQEVFPAETASRSRENDRRALASGTGVQVIETLEYEGGDLHYSLVSKFPIPSPDGEAALVGGIAIDVTDRMRAEEALREADRRKDEFLATLAHELRNPLAPIRNAVEVLKAKGSPDPDLTWGRDVIDRQPKQMARLLEDLLDVSRISRNKLELRKSRVLLASMAETAVETSRPLIEGGGHELAVALPDEPIDLDADPVRLAQVFANLLNNAAKYTDRGGHIRLTAERVGHEVAVSVKDTGIGIAVDMLPRLFEMFSQATPALERSQGGLGIGLALVKGLVEMHGGTIEARSDGPGRGSEFVVRLPVAIDPRPQDKPSDNGVDAVAAAGRRVLVADDNRDAADSLAMMLRIEGHEVRTAHDGQQAVALAGEFRPDLVLLDIEMPTVDGYEAARRIRAQPWGQDMTLVALTGWCREEDRQRAAEVGFDSHMVKPVDPAVLETLLGAVAPRQG